MSGQLQCLVHICLASTKGARQKGLKFTNSTFPPTESSSLGAQGTTWSTKSPPMIAKLQQGWSHPPKTWQLWVKYHDITLTGKVCWKWPKTGLCPPPAIQRLPALGMLALWLSYPAQPSMDCRRPSSTDPEGYLLSNQCWHIQLTTKKNVPALLLSGVVIFVHVCSLFFIFNNLIIPFTRIF